LLRLAVDIVQVFISYGPKSNGELLLSYGFSSGTSNPHEAAQMVFSLSPGDRFFEAKKAAMVARQIPCTERFAVKIDSLPAGMLPYLAFISAPIQADEDAELLAVELFDLGNLPGLMPSGVSAEGLALSTLAQHCKRALKASCFSQQQQDADRQLAATVSAGGGWEQRQAVVAAVRLRERQILSRTEFVAQQRLRQLRKGGSR
jgi:histone-lysine N-methyltransferase SETD3